MDKRRILFISGIVLGIAGLIYALIDLFFSVDLYALTPFAHMKCGFRQLTGLYCPGCGGTRAILALARGRVLSSFYYHPLPLYFVILYGNFAVRYLFRKHLKPAKFRIIYVIIPVVLLLGNWILKNALLIAGHPM